MKRGDIEPEYRRRIEKKAREDEQRFRRKRQESDVERHASIISDASQRIEQALDRFNNEQTPQKRSDRRWEHIGILGLWVAAFVGMTAIWFGTNDAQEQRKEMRGELNAAHRAWIKIVKIEIAPPGLQINENGVSLPLSFKVKNVGRGPAINGSWHVWLVPGPAGTGRPTTATSQDNTCEDFRTRPIGKAETAIFPDDDFPSSGVLIVGASTSIDDIRNVMHEGQPIPESFDLSIVGCFDYTFPTDMNRHHQTGFRATIWRKVKHVDQLLAIPPFDFMLDMGTIPPDNLVLQLFTTYVPAD